MERKYGLLQEFLENIGYYNMDMNIWERIAIGLGVIIIATLIYYVCLKVIIPLIIKITEKTSIAWDDHIFNTKVLKCFCELVFAMILYEFMPLAFHEDGPALIFTMRIIKVLIIAVIGKTLIALVSSLQSISKQSDSLGKKPLKGIYQMLKIIIISIVTILAIAEIFDKNPSALLTGLGASAAVIMLIFKDSILGLVAGVQLSVNDMLRPGDWIVMNKYGADGTVFEVTLTTVKVRNWDNTIVTLPPYLLVSDSFQNWRGMEESGGRRIKRSIFIDMTSVKFCTEEDLKKYEEKKWLDYVNKEERTTNLTVLRSYIEKYLTNNKNINNGLTIMVRQLQPTAEGLPLEIYCFSSIKSFKPYEGVQADIFDHIIAMIPEFGLRVFQVPSGNDIKSIARYKD